MYVPLLPHPGEAATESEWLDKVRLSAQEQLGLSIAQDELLVLWKIAFRVVDFMDLNFRRPGRRERCYGCWKRLRCDYSDGAIPPKLPPEGYCNSWYGSTGVERMHALCRCDVLAGLLLAWNECKKLCGDVSSEVSMLERRVGKLMDDLLLWITEIKESALNNLQKIKKGAGDYPETGEQRAEEAKRELLAAARRCETGGRRGGSVGQQV